MGLLGGHLRVATALMAKGGTVVLTPVIHILMMWKVLVNECMRNDLDELGPTGNRCYEQRDCDRPLHSPTLLHAVSSLQARFRGLP